MIEPNWTLRKRKGALHARAKIIQAVRQFFITGGYLEVETPLRIPAPAPESHIEAIGSEGWFLQTSPELCMKRLLAAGYDRLFQLSHCWRDGERGRRHLPEFTMLEWYRQGDYRDLMHDCENLLNFVVVGIGMSSEIRVGDRTVSLGRPWERISVREAFERHASMPMETALERDLFDELMVTVIEPKLGLETPSFLYDYPLEHAALARRRKDDPAVAERFELYVAGVELANGFSELNDAVEQRDRFQAEARFRQLKNKKEYMMPEKFLAELPCMPDSAGIALGIDRLVMTILDCCTIDDVVAFTPEDL